METGITTAVESAYRAAHQHALVIAHDDPGVVRLTGDDRLDLLNRISTNDLRDLAAGRWARTILTNALARIVDVVTVFQRSSDSLLMTSPGKAADVMAWLSGYIFFQDEVTVSVLDLDFGLWGIYGHHAADRLPDLGISALPDQAGTFTEGEETILWKVDQPAPGGVQVLLSGTTAARARDVWTSAAELAAVQAFEILRIESGLPRAGFEITDETIPLEVGLWNEVSFTKGCFIGQEILTRMESRGQLARRLVLLRFADALQRGSMLYLQGRNVGHVTSIAFSPRQGWIGLALVKPAALEAETLIAGSEGIEARILDPLRSRQTRSTPSS